jgi:hypothetical protein
LGISDQKIDQGIRPKKKLVRGEDKLHAQEKWKKNLAHDTMLGEYAT